MEALKDCGITTLPNNLQLTIELDIFQSPSGLIMAEVEFPSIELANAYRMPDWFAEDVTQNKAYHNSNISKGGPVFDPTPSFLEDGN
jgi:CYTH domain-containing protein